MREKRRGGEEGKERGRGVKYPDEGNLKMSRVFLPRVVSKRGF